MTPENSEISMGEKWTPDKIACGDFSGMILTP
jgi:hypothetical protein